uniref:rRNA-processing protein UTP23 homolog n=1 Tax=Setaria digitata TaxID=48799 RepID=A0A915PVD6_9BILA
MVFPVLDMPNERKLYKYAAYLSKCSREAVDYGNCVGQKAGKVTHLACQREFTLLLNCMEKQHNFGLQPPYQVLLDGTFALAALQNKINLREQMPKYLNAEVDIRVTSCVLKELEKLGSALYGALHICKQFDVEFCPHQPVRTATECIKHMARRIKHRTTYFFATQDKELTESLKQIPGIPVLFIKYNGILIDRPGQATMQEIEKPKDELLDVKELKKAVFGEVEKPRRKRKGPKGPNPLSVKKKKLQSATTDEKSSTGVRTFASRRRRRKRKEGNESRCTQSLTVVS